MDKKVIIKELACIVQTKLILPVQTYGRIRKKLANHDVSEIGLYSAIADHLIENDIKPTSFAPETAYAIEQIANNPFAIKTDNELFFLRRRWEDIKISGVDKKKQLCNKCFEIVLIDDMSPRKNYKNTCTACVSQVHKTNYKSKPPQKPVVPSLEKQDTKPLEIPQEPIEPIEIPQESIEIKEPFITIESVIGEGKSTTITLNVPMEKLGKLFDIFEDHLITQTEQ